MDWGPITDHKILNVSQIEIKVAIANYRTDAKIKQS